MLNKLQKTISALMSGLSAVENDVLQLKKLPAPKDGVSPAMADVVAEVLAQMPTPKDGVSPVVEDIVADVLAQIPTPKDGEPGADVDIDAVAFKVFSVMEKPKDGNSPKLADVVSGVLAQMPTPKDGVSPSVDDIVTRVLAKMPAPAAAEMVKKARDGKNGVSVTKVKLEKGNQLAVWLDGVRRVVGKIEIPKPAAEFTPAQSGGGGKRTTKPWYKKQVVVQLPSQLSGVLRSDVLYYLDGVVDFTGSGLNISVPAGGLNLAGHTFDVSGLKCDDGDYTLFVSPAGGSGNILGRDYFIEVSGAGSKVYDIFDATGFSAFEFQRINYNNCSSRGEISGYRQGLEEGTGYFGGKPELTLSGTWLGGYFLDVSIVRNLEDGVYSLFKAGANFVMTSRFRSNQNIDLPASASFIDFSPANFVRPSTVQLVGCLVSRNGVVDSSDANIIPNLAPSDLASEWVSNNGIGNTFVGGELNITTEVTTPIAATGTFVDLLGTYTSDDLQHFDEPANGQLRHLGESPLEYSVGGQFVLDSGGNNEVDLKIVIFRAATTTFEDGKTLRRVINNQQGGRDVAYFVLSDDIILNQNDYVKLQVANVNNTTNITAELDSFLKIRAR